MKPRREQPTEAQRCLEITIPALARATGWTRHTTLRRLRASDCVLRERGQGTKRKHFGTTWLDIENSNASWILEAIKHMSALFARATSAAGADEEGDD